MDDDSLQNSISGLSDITAPTLAPQPANLPAGVTQVAQPAQPQGQPAAPASAPVVGPNTPHAGLLNMMTTIAVGFDSLGKSLATHGQEGGATEVNQYLQAQKDQKLKQDANQRENTQAMANIQHLQALTNATIAQTEINKINAPIDYQNKVIENQKSLYDLYVNTLHINPLFAVPIVQGQGTDTHMAGINSKANGDLVNNTVIPVHDDKVGGAGNSYGFSFDQLRKVNVPIDQAGPVLQNLQNQIDYAKATLPNGEKDPTVQAAQGKLDVLKKGATVNGYDFFTFNNQVQGNLLARVNNQQAIQDFQQKQAAAVKAKNEADPLYKMENEPSEMSGEKASAAIPLLQNKLTNPATTPQDKVRASRLLAQANSAHANYMQDQVQKANAEQTAKQGDPNAAGTMLANGDLTLADMKNRGMTSKFMMQAVTAAKQVSPTYKPADEMAAEQVAKSPSQNQFFGSANSLISKGGTLDQVVDAGAKLPNFKFPVFNKLADAQNYSSGHPEVAAYMQTALGAADDYAKVLGGGAGTEGMQMHILNAMNQSLNQDQRVAVTNSMRKAVNSQVESRIGNNKFLNRMYGYALPQNQPQQKPFDPATEAHPIQANQ